MKFKFNGKGDEKHRSKKSFGNVRILRKCSKTWAGTVKLGVVVVFYLFFFVFSSIQHQVPVHSFDWPSGIAARALIFTTTALGRLTAWIYLANATFRKYTFGL